MLRRLIAKILRKKVDTTSPTLPPDDYDQEGCAVILVATTAMAYFLMF